MWFDSHCHLQDQYLGAEGALADALGRAAGAGVGRMICVGTGAATSGSSLAMARRSAAGTLPLPDEGAPVPRVWATVGLHPHDATDGTEATTRLVEEAVAAGDDALVAVGECGLDYHYDHSPRVVQRRAFAEQVALAHRHGLALVIHARDAWGDLFDVLAAEGVPERTVLHCFTGGPDEARRCLDAGMYVSFSGIVTFKTAVEVREAAALVPLGRLLVETDSPFLAPVPHRGKPNEPALLPLVGEAVAAVKGVGAEELAESTDRAAREVFGLQGGT